MSKTQPNLRTIEINGPRALEKLLGHDPETLLRNLGGPAWITLPGRDSSKRRAIVTLLHGNEPSGLKAIHELLTEGLIPETNLGILIASVDAALHEPCFSHRYIPGEHDLNRCFKPTGSSNQTHLANNIVAKLEQFAPEAVVDTHNTSSHSEPFCVAIRSDAETRQLASLFTHSLVVIDQPLGTLLEVVPAHIPVVTVEFGGFMDPNADWLARETLHRFMMLHDLTHHDATGLRLLSHPIRLETQQHLQVTYSSSIDEHADLTVINTIDQLNFRQVPAGTTLGWFRDQSHRHLVALDRHGIDRFSDFFDESGGALRTKKAFTVFMATTDPGVANTDCLLYFT